VFKSKERLKMLRLYRNLSKMSTDEAVKWMKKQLGKEHIDALNTMLGILEREFGKVFTYCWFDMFKYGLCSNAAAKQKVDFYVLVFLAWTGFIKFYCNVEIGGDES